MNQRWNSCKKRMKTLIKNKPIMQLLIFFILVTVFLIENNINLGGHKIYSKLDDMIPFVPAFIIAYCLWYVFIAYTGITFMMKSKIDLRKTFFAVNICMFIGLLVYFIYPNYITIRPKAYGSDIFSQAVRFLQEGDSPDSVCPSLHVAVCIALCAGICNSVCYNKKNYAKIISILLTILISISTVFVKQHSVIDVAFGTILGLASYIFVYKIYFNEKLFPSRVGTTEEISYSMNN